MLKDIWIDYDRMREGAVLAQLYDDADEEGRKLVRKHFLTTICHGDVWTKPGVVDDTRNGLMRGLELPKSTFELRQKESVIVTSKFASGSGGLRATSRLHLPHPNRKYTSKTHYRIVFKELGTTIDMMPCYHDVIQSLLDIVTGMF